MLFTDDFISGLRSDPIDGTITLCKLAFSAIEGDDRNEGWQQSHFEVLIEAYSLLVEVVEAGLLPLPSSVPRIGGSLNEDCSAIYQYLINVQQRLNAERSKLRVQSLRSKFRASLGSGFAYEFSQGDLDRVQAILNQLRELIASTEQFEKEHQQRLLRRLEKLQSEIHKKVSDLDRFWGLIGDAGVVLGKLGNDAKPIVDRIREIADIVWRTQSRAEELPSGTRMPTLEYKSSDE